MQKKPSKITILGIGNILYSDEGIGVYCIPFLEEIYADCEDVDVVYGATDGMMLLATVEDAEKLLIIDAINAAAEPGTIIHLQGDEVPKYVGVKMSIHQLGFSEVLVAANFREQYPEQIVMIGMQPFSLELHADVTEQGKEVAKQLILEVRKQVDEWRQNQ